MASMSAIVSADARQLLGVIDHFVWVTL